MTNLKMANVSETSLFTFCGRNSEEDIEEITEEVIIDFSKTAVSWVCLALLIIVKCCTVIVISVRFKGREGYTEDKTPSIHKARTPYYHNVVAPDE